MNPNDPHAAVLLAKPRKYWLRCQLCHLGRTPMGTPCRPCGGRGKIAHEVKR